MNYCTASGLTSLGTAFGLAQVAGINAYLPLLVLVVVSRWFHLCSLNSHFSFMTQNWFLIGLAVLTLADLVTDKIPFLASFWDAVHTIIRPIAGGLVSVAAVSGNQFTAAHSSAGLLAATSGSHLAGMMVYQGFLAILQSGQISGTVSLILFFLVGCVMAGMVHITKAGIRFTSTGLHALTAGLSNVILSVIEDGVAVVGIVLSLFVPAIMLVLVVLFVLFFLFSYRRMRRGLHWR
jgi:Domain of unknown function (DUF4126)